ncbi:hypothetical protein SHKM778_91150 [Streptomyces sp. KM77-8]|uniref:Uncharacterized protein n=1 Tax=Streptomyces haneummycinicus TaxID=3074435 RepID=A0AAT9HZM8_9ACTN
MGAVKNFRVYHPESHYWPLQLVASGILLVIAVLVTVAAFQLLRRRTGRTKV